MKSPHRKKWGKMYAIVHTSQAPLEPERDYGRNWGVCRSLLLLSNVVCLSEFAFIRFAFKLALSSIASSAHLRPWISTRWQEIWNSKNDTGALKRAAVGVERCGDEYRLLSSL